MRAALPTVWGDVSAADRGDRLRQRNPFSKGFSSIDSCKNFYKSTEVNESPFYFVVCIGSESAQSTVSVDFVFIKFTVKHLEFLVSQFHIVSVQVLDDTLLVF